MNVHYTRMENSLVPRTHIITVMLAMVAATPFAATAQSSENSTTSEYNYQFDPNFNPQFTVTIVVLVLAFFFIGFFAIFVRQCADISNGRPSLDQSSAVESRSRRTTKGLDSSVIQTFPILMYSDIKQLKIGKGALECAICIAEFEDNETLRFVPKCSHVFHPECIDAWLASHSTCPVCRANLSHPIMNKLGAHSEGGAESMINPLSTHSRGEVSTDTQNQVCVTVQDHRDMRMMLTRKFPRSHSTGHDSLVQPGENCERYTLRLPEEIQKHIVMLKRSTSCVVVLGGSRVLTS